MFFKVAPMNKVIHFGKKGKLSPQYIGPFQIRDRVDEVAYRLFLSPNMTSIYNVFHVFVHKSI